MVCLTKLMGHSCFSFRRNKHGKVKWYHGTFPSCEGGFDHRRAPCSPNRRIIQSAATDSRQSIFDVP
jgi:hypothetical protein